MISVTSTTWPTAQSRLWLVARTQARIVEGDGRSGRAVPQMQGRGAGIFLELFKQFWPIH
jgi:hypothetical protein